MSTKIYNGYKLPMMSITELKDFTDRLREKMSEVSKDIFIQRMSTLIINMIDYSYILSKEEFLRHFKIEDDNFLFDLPLYLAAQNIIDKRNKQIQTKQIYDTDFDFSCQICLIPIDNKILCLYFGEAPEFLNAFESFENIESYYYFNNTDRPDEISEEEWEQRKKDWDKALPGIGIPSENGFIVQLNKDIPFIFKGLLENIIKESIFFENRVHKLAKEKIFSEKVKELISRIDNQKDLDLLDVYDWLKTDGAENQLKEKMKEISEILPKEITEKMIKEMKLKDLFNNYKK